MNILSKTSIDLDPTCALFTCSRPALENPKRNSGFLVTSTTFPAKRSGVLCYEDVYSGGSLYSFGRCGCRDYGYPNSHGLKDFILAFRGPFSKEQPKQQRPLRRGPHVRNVTRDYHPRNLAQPLHGRSRIRSDNAKLEIWNGRSNGWENAFGEIQYAVYIRVVVHAPDKHDHRLTLRGATVG